MSEKDILISQFIDDELTLGEKSEFVREIHGDKAFYEDTLSMLGMEEELTPSADAVVPEIKYKKRFSFQGTVPYLALAASLAVMIKVFLFAPAAPQEIKMYQRFVIHAPDAKNVALTGSFSGWQKINMKKADNGYWEVSLPLDKGEYTYSYLINGEEQMPDPTVAAKQTDDFGGENSVIHIGENI